MMFSFISMPRNTGSLVSGGEGPVLAVHQDAQERPGQCPQPLCSCSWPQTKTVLGQQRPCPFQLRGNRVVREPFSVFFHPSGSLLLPCAPFCPGNTREPLGCVSGTTGRLSGFSCPNGRMFQLSRSLMQRPQLIQANV